jgi:heptosyltransferase II
MIYVVDRKRRIIVYLINLALFPFSFVYKLIKWNWKPRKSEILYNIYHNKFSNIYFNVVERMGDILFFTPLAVAIKKRFPNTSIHVITNKVGESILKSNPYIDELIIVKSNWVAKTNFSIKEFLQIFDKKYFSEIFDIRKRNIDLLIEVSGDFRSLLFFDIWLNAKYISGYSRSGLSWLLNWEMHFPVQVHEIDVRLSIATQLDAKIVTRQMQVFLDEEEINFANDFLSRKGIQESDFKIGFFMGGTWPQRIWPLDNYINLAARLISEYESKVVLIGDPSMGDLFNCFIEKIPGAIRTDGYTLRQNAAIISKLDIMISNDSGPMHLARSLNVPTIGLFGPESQIRVGLEDGGIGVQNIFPCHPCGQTKCNLNPNCVASISVDDVLSALERLSMLTGCGSTARPAWPARR